MKDGLYHKLIGLPAGSTAPWLGDLTLVLSDHATRACVTDRYGKIDLMTGDVERVEVCDIIEIEICEGRPVKALVRLSWDETRDIVLALAAPGDRSVTRPGAPSVRVKTVWFNLKSDKHKTLRRELYSKP